KAEMDWGNGTIRHRMFAIIDRTQVQSFPTYNDFSKPNCRANNAVVASTLDPTTLQLVPRSFTLLNAQDQDAVALGVANPNTGLVWKPQVGALLTFEPDTDNEETVEVTNVTGSTIQAAFAKDHDTTKRTIAVINRGNPGPWKQYDPGKDPTVVPYYIMFE